MEMDMEKWRGMERDIEKWRGKGKSKWMKCF